MVWQKDRGLISLPYIYPMRSSDSESTQHSNTRRTSTRQPDNTSGCSPARNMKCLMFHVIWSCTRNGAILYPQIIPVSNYNHCFSRLTTVSNYNHCFSRLTTCILYQAYIQKSGQRQEFQKLQAIWIQVLHAIVFVDFSRQEGWPGAPLHISNIMSHGWSQYYMIMHS